ncbi:MAG TPA: DUF4168 domain-containing protein [Reyranella sp.]|nr:DUF4168 domain-containing protein [Reyranella sp.]
MQAISRFLAIGFGAASFLIVPMVNAQNQSPSPPTSTTTPGSAAKPDLSDKKLDAVAAAVKDVSTDSDTYKKKLAQAPDSEKEKILDQADEAAMKAVTDKGLSVEEYMSIMKVAENDSTVRDKLIARLK